MKKTALRNPMVFVAAFLAAAILVGCGVQKDDDIFFVKKNYYDDEPVKKVLKDYQSALNARDLGSLMNCFSEGLDFPDRLDNSLRVTYRNLLYDYKDFFEKIETINYAFNDIYILLNENSAKVTMKLHREYKAVSPFSNHVNADVEEQVTVTKISDGVWKVTQMRELLPPRIY